MGVRQFFGPVGLILSGMPFVFGFVGEPARVEPIAVATDVIFTRDVLSVLKATCNSCHGEGKQSAGLRLDSYAAILKGSEAGKVVIPGKSRESVLIDRLRGAGGEAQMPLGFRPLSEAQIRTIERWIDEGAKETGTNYQHWAFVKPVRPAVPEVQNSVWCRNEIDKFVMFNLEKEGLSHSTEADKETLVRRVYLDVLGMPPSWEEAQVFLNDPSPDAYEKMVDRVFASPHYGERQARIWLDLARYADSQGYEKDANRTMWPWRDWVIGAFNSNMRFDEFTLEQFAGDLVSDGDMNKIVATGFHRNTMMNEEGGVDQGEARWLTLVDRVGTVGTTWLGTTVACAQCHNHKYDPISQKEFYQFLAFFENVDEPQISLTPEVAKRIGEIDGEVKALDSRLGNALTLESDKASLGEKKKSLQDERGKLFNVTTLVMRDKPGAKAETPIRERGGYLSPGEVVSAGTPAFLGAGAKSQDRIGLAKWLVSRDNPMTARVQVNRMWEQHFGVGLVKTSENLGTQGEMPSHQELLDWLAVEFMESGWDMKVLHKKIVLSATYRQSSDVTPAMVERDPENRLLARGPRFRLEAEALRDSVFTVSGLLTEKVGGPSVMPVQPNGVWDTPYNGQSWVIAQGENRYRRSLYTFMKRSSPFPMMLTFDGTSREFCTPRRERTNTPLQALNFLNDPGLLEGAVALARKVRSKNMSEGVKVVVQHCLIREPDDREVILLSGLFERTKAKYSTALEAAKKLCGEPDADLAAWTLVVNTVMNTDEFLTLE
ncbi:MAG: PSD1 and planctomycete cytochrome C domain-containing protein [Fimbriimonadaceae bacterium]